MNNKKRITFAILLLLLITVVVYFFCCNKKEKQVLQTFTLQGTTTINQGDIKLKIWDNSAEDGDSVKVYLDNKLLRDTLGLLNEPLQLNFGKLSKGEHLLGVVAINEGSTSPASASMSLSNETEKKAFEMDATKDSAASWKIIIQ